MTEHPSARSSLWTWAAFLCALVVVAGSLYLSMGMKLIACPLCFYQRTFAMSVAGVLAIGLLTGAARGGVLSLLALPAAVGGVGVAAFHVFLELNGTLECPVGILGLGTAPQQSLAVFAVLLLFLVVDALAPRVEGGPRFPAFAASVILGLLFAAGCIASAPPPPEPKPDPEPPKACRQPYRGP